MPSTTQARGHVGVNGFHGGKFTWKNQNAAEAGAFLVADDYVEEYDVTDFHARVAGGFVTEVTDLNIEEQFAATAATKAVSDVWVLDNLADIRELGLPEVNDYSWVDATAYRDGGRTLINVQHKDDSKAPVGSLFVFNPDGSVDAYDDHSDNFGERWTPIGGYRDQLFREHLGNSREGGVGDFL